MSLDPRFSSRAVSRVMVRKTDEAAKLRRAFLILSAASALVLCSVALAKAETWVTVNPDGSVTRTETKSSAAVTAEDEYAQDEEGEDGAWRYKNNRDARDDRYRDEDERYYDGVEQRNTQRAVVGNTTIFSGTYYPIPQNYYGYYPYPNYNVQPPGYTYPIGPVINPRVPPPTITNGPIVSSGPLYVLPGHGYYPPYNHYPYPVYNYPAYGMNGTYYSGPAGGGGTVYSSTTTQNRGTGLSYGRRGGLRINLGGGTTTTESTTTVTTTGPR